MDVYVTKKLSRIMIAHSFVVLVNKQAEGK